MIWSVDGNTAATRLRWIPPAVLALRPSDDSSWIVKDAETLAACAFAPQRLPSFLPNSHFFTIYPYPYLGRGDTQSQTLELRFSILRPSALINFSFCTT